MKEIITVEGYEKIKEELKYLISVRRLENASNLKYATDLGDLRENAEYDAALMEYEEIESRIYKLEKIINNCIIKKSTKKDFIDVGSKVLIEYEDGEKDYLEIVGTSEVDPLENKISYLSPLGSVLINSKIGNSLIVETESMEYQVKILDII